MNDNNILIQLTATEAEHLIKTLIGSVRTLSDDANTYRTMAYDNRRRITELEEQLKQYTPAEEDENEEVPF